MLNTNRIKNLIFDFDGVIIDSVEIKNKAFLQTVRGYSNLTKKKFMKFHLENLGVSRIKKYEFLCKTILKIKKSKILEKKFSNNYSKIIEKKLKRVNYIKGVKRFISNNKKKNLFIISGTPQKELIKICNKKEISKYFSMILGSPKTKNQNVEILKKKHKINGRNTIFFGDANTDFEVAKRNSFFFIQVGNNLKNTNVKFKIKDFNDNKIKKYF